MVNSATFKLTAMTAIAHQDASPQANNGSNTKPFNRSLAKIESSVESVSREIVKSSLEKILNYFPVHPPTAEILETATGAELIAAMFVSQYPVNFGGDGDGLFTGLSRYDMLSKKLQDAATFNLRLSGLYQSLTEFLCLGNRYPKSQLALATMPHSIQSSVSVACLKSPQFVVALGREIAEGTIDPKRKESKYQQEPGGYVPTDKQIDSLCQSSTDSLIMAIPDLSGNAIGHQLRSAIALDLIEYLDIDITTIPTGVAYILFHGGQRSKGVKTPGDADLLEAKIRHYYPLLDAVGGCPDAFLMTAGRCKLQAHILCQERNWITEKICGLREERSIFEMLDFVTMTRSGEGGNSSDSGQMIFSHEVLCQGTEAILKLDFTPHTSENAIGAVLSGMRFWKERDGLFGGKSARNFGRFAISEVAKEVPESSIDRYREFLDGNKKEIISGLQDGSLASGKIVCYAGLI